MLTALACSPEREPDKGSKRFRETPIHRMRRILRGIEVNGPCEFYRAQLVQEFKALFRPDDWNGPLRAA